MDIPPLWYLLKGVTPKGSAIIDFVEAAYDLGAEPREWLPMLIEAAAPIFDHGLGLFAVTCQRPAQPGPLVIDQLHASAPDTGFAARMAELQASIDMSLLWPITRPGLPKTLSEVSDAHSPDAFRLVMDHFPFAKDGLGINAFDPDGNGVFLIGALPKVTTLTPKAREHWQMIAAHFGAGYRLRRAIECEEVMGEGASPLPHGAEVVIDPTGFRVIEALGPAKSASAREALRGAARQVDQARGPMRDDDSEGALEVWKALVRGRWSTVDWFDSDGRRYVLGIPNAPGLDDPRGLSERELQVVAYVYYGLTNKLIAYHLGLSRARISGVLSSAMRKLGVRSRAHLIKRLKEFEVLTKP